MKKREAYSRATFDALLSRMVISRTKKQAIEKAAYELNITNLSLDQMTLKNEKGETKVFTVNQVEMLDWYEAERTESSHQFKVFGRIRLAISTPEETNVQDETERSIYKFPRTSLYEKPVLVISEGLDHFFLTVLRQEMEWESAIVTGINRFSKLA